ncbi:MAG: phage head morphogenesis protein, partial [Bacteroidetes bacterium]|nr:phage head morphogenesis protein [Bacteroidota bacterium]
AMTAIAKSMRMGLRKIISREQRTMYTLGELHVQRELQRQQSIQLVRRDPPSVQQVIELFKVRSQAGIDAFAERSQRFVREAALEAWKVYGDSLTPRQLGQVIGEALDVSGRQSELFSRRLGMESFNMGRDRRARLQYDAIEDVEYSALMDGNVCESCADADGTVTTIDSPTYFKLMPPNHQCRSRKSGFNNCRCMWLYRVRDEVSDLPDPATLFKPPSADGTMRVRTGVEI